MLWPRRMKRTARKTANSNFPIPNEGSRPAGGVGLFESVVIWATSLANQVAAVTSTNPITGNFRRSSNLWAPLLISLRQQGGALTKRRSATILSTASLGRRRSGISSSRSEAKSVGYGAAQRKRAPARLSRLLTFFNAFFGRACRLHLRFVSYPAVRACARSKLFSRRGRFWRWSCLFLLRSAAAESLKHNRRNRLPRRRPHPLLRCSSPRQPPLPALRIPRLNLPHKPAPRS